MGPPNYRSSGAPDCRSKIAPAFKAELPRQLERSSLLQGKNC